MRCASPLALAAAVAALLASGCASPAAHVAGCAAACPASGPPTIVLDGCAADHFLIAAPSGKVAALLPAGYSLPEGPTVPVTLSVLRCDAAIVGNRTRTPPFAMLAAEVEVMPPAGPAREGAATHFYTLERLVAGEARGILMEAGLPVRPAEAEARPGAAGPRHTFIVEDATYVLEATTVPPGAVEEQAYAYRLHAAGSWHDAVAVAREGPLVGAGSVTLDGGMLAPLAPLAPALSWALASHGSNPAYSLTLVPKEGTP